MPKKKKWRKMFSARYGNSRNTADYDRFGRYVGEMISAQPGMPRDSRRIEDADSSATDHAADCVR